MMRRRCCPVIPTGSATFAGFRFSGRDDSAVRPLVSAVRVVVRDLEELLAERGIEV